MGLSNASPELGLGLWACDPPVAKALAPFLAPVKSVRVQKLVMGGKSPFRARYGMKGLAQLPVLPVDPCRYALRPTEASKVAVQYVRSTSKEAVRCAQIPVVRRGLDELVE